MFLFSTPTFFIPFNSPMPFFCLFLPSSLYTWSAASFISLLPLSQLLSCRNLTGTVSLSFWSTVGFFFFLLFSPWISYISTFSTFFLTIYKNLFLWAELSVMIYSSNIYIMCVQISVYFIISHWPLLHWKFYLKSKNAWTNQLYI